MEDDTIAKSGDYDFGNLKYLDGPRYTSIEYTFDKSPFVYKVIYDDREYYFYRRESYHILATKVPEDYPTKANPNKVGTLHRVVLKSVHMESKVEVEKLK
ncbi:TPA: hypothetical protein SG275_001505 [Campylobacter coli]|nr:hypothetical protein [Campylobacter coli]